MSSITSTNWLVSWSTAEWWHAGTRTGRLVASSPKKPASREVHAQHRSR